MTKLIIVRFVVKDRKEKVRLKYDGG